MSKCIKLAGKVGKIPECDIPRIIKHSYFRDQFDKDLIQKICDMFCDIKRVNIYIQSKVFENECDLEEEHMMTKFKQEKIPDNVIAKISNPSVKNVKIPEANALVPGDVTILAPNPEYTSKPVNVSTIPETDVWYMQDAKYKQPKGIVQLKMLVKDDTGFGIRVFAKLWAMMQKDF